jgi:hypothetical protein
VKVLLGWSTFRPNQHLTNQTFAEMFFSNSINPLAHSAFSYWRYFEIAGRAGRAGNSLTTCSGQSQISTSWCWTQTHFDKQIPKPAYKPKMTRIGFQS